MIKLIATDMDGTLLNEQGYLSYEIFDIIKKLNEKDILFATASGRQYYNLENKFSPVKDDIIYIAENGCYVVNKDTEISSNYLDKKIVKDLIHTARKVDGIDIVLCGKKAAYIEKDSKEFINEVEKYYYRYEIVEDLNKVEDDILKFALFDPKGPEINSNKIFSPLFGDKLLVVVSGKVWLDIINKDINKGIAIKQLQKKYNIKPEETMVFGDYFNDIDMLQSAYHSYAMDNAPEEVKMHARFIAKSNRENGVIDVIKSLVLE
ncbi:Cof-type HAD-IIB family hydrolase [Clostridium omnivorum]|uniref:Haloacid dehalogenase n=1 Tax=Clostridium omnivorum TaxID=1604902 RepID=A0ABQ5N7L1_9CLOT|nr:HAD family hydrolase [Clostridium sp. E14]GLC31074.1 haloacid dehalogenase [Clostridium sp. E14]